MSKVVNFPIERTNQSERPLSAGSADIVIFPGVRIERREFNLADRHAKVGHGSNAKAVAKNPTRN